MIWDGICSTVHCTRIKLISFKKQYTGCVQKVLHLNFPRHSYCWSEIGPLGACGRSAKLSKLWKRYDVCYWKPLRANRVTIKRLSTTGYEPAKIFAQTPGVNAAFPWRRPKKTSFCSFALRYLWKERVFCP